MKLIETDPKFQATIGRLAAIAGKTADEVYALWEQYETDCRSADQSAVLFEFCQWNEVQLGGDLDKLRDAIDARHDEAGNAGCDRCGVNDRAPGSEECPDCENQAAASATATTTPEPEAEKPQKWANSHDNPAGKIQCKRFNDAHSRLTSEHNTHREKWGVIGGEEHESCMLSLFGGGCREDVRKVQLEIGKKYGWTVSKVNVNQIIADIEAALPELSKNRPCTDKRRTVEQEASDNARYAEIEAKRKADEAAKNGEADKIAVDLRAKYPWARPASEALSNHARAAANVREELGRTFPGITFSVRSDYNSIRIGWELGPDERQVDEITKKYKNGHWDGMEDIHKYDSSAYGKAVEQVLGRVTYFSNSRRYDTTEHSQTLAPILCKLVGAPYNPHVEPWNQKLPDGESLGTAVRIILANSSFPPGAVITGLEVREDANDSGASGRDYHLLYKVVFTVPHRDATSANGGRTFGALGTVAYNKEHNGVEIAFTDKPSDDLRYRLKRAGFRITRRPPWKWYQKFSATAWAAACELAGVTAEAPKTDDDGAGSYVAAQESQYFDNQAALCNA